MSSKSGSSEVKKALLGLQSFRKGVTTLVDTCLTYEGEHAKIQQLQHDIKKSFGVLDGNYEKVRSQIEATEKESHGDSNDFKKDVVTQAIYKTKKRKQREVPIHWQLQTMLETALMEQQYTTNTPSTHNYNIDKQGEGYKLCCAIEQIRGIYQDAQMKHLKKLLQVEFGQLKIARMIAEETKQVLFGSIQELFNDLHFTHFAEDGMDLTSAKIKNLIESAYEKDKRLRSGVRKELHHQISILLDKLRSELFIDLLLTTAALKFQTKQVYANPLDAQKIQCFIPHGPNECHFVSLLTKNEIQKKLQQCQKLSSIKKLEEDTKNQVVQIYLNYISQVKSQFSATQFEKMLPEFLAEQRAQISKELKHFTSQISRYLDAHIEYSNATEIRLVFPNVFCAIIALQFPGSVQATRVVILPFEQSYVGNTFNYPQNPLFQTLSKQAMEALSYFQERSKIFGGVEQPLKDLLAWLVGSIDLFKQRCEATGNLLMYSMSAGSYLPPFIRDYKFCSQELLERAREVCNNESFLSCRHIQC